MRYQGDTIRELYRDSVSGSLEATSSGVVSLYGITRSALRATLLPALRTVVNEPELASQGS